VVPVKSVDGLPVGNGARGPITKALQAAFFGIFDGSTKVPEGWLDKVE
jgi:branched-chain amino acid aminotransferase